jgi:hypothetical protein
MEVAQILSYVVGPSKSGPKFTFKLSREAMALGLKLN